MQKDKLGQDMFLIGCVVASAAFVSNCLLSSCSCSHCFPDNCLGRLDPRVGGWRFVTVKVCTKIGEQWCPLSELIVHRRATVTRREAEYVALSADTTEGDLKQRREIINGSVQHLDQPPVIAATQGRILILEGARLFSSVCALLAALTRGV